MVLLLLLLLILLCPATLVNCPAGKNKLTCADQKLNCLLGCWVVEKVEGKIQKLSLLVQKGVRCVVYTAADKEK